MRSNIFALIYTGILIILLSNCEGFSTAEGIVKDKATDKPLDSVLCKVITGHMEVYTDSLGAFSVQNQMGGCVGGCEEITVEFSKKGYQTVTKTQESASGTIYMEK